MARSRIMLPVGHKVGMLTVIGEAVQGGSYRRYMWLCRCDCGNTKRVATAHLLSKAIKSCGCATGPKISDMDRGRKAVITRYKRAAKSRGFIWDLSDNQAVSLMESACFYCGSMGSCTYKIVERAHFDSRQYLYNGIDRIDSSKGYTPDNVVAACAQCNYAKGNMNQNEFIDWAHRMSGWQRRLNKNM